MKVYSFGLHTILFPYVTPSTPYFSRVKWRLLVPNLLSVALRNEVFSHQVNSKPLESMLLVQRSYLSLEVLPRLSVGNEYFYRYKGSPLGRASRGDIGSRYLRRDTSAMGGDYVSGFLYGLSREREEQKPLRGRSQTSLSKTRRGTMKRVRGVGVPAEGGFHRYKYRTLTHRCLSFNRESQ